MATHQSQVTCKRFLDILSSTLVGLMILPLLLVIAGLVCLSMGSPVLFRQQRPGLNGKPFIFYKFRTMTAECDEAGCLLPDECRLTPFGEFLRKTSLDELPQLWNVLLGEMSLVGPRPLLMEYLPRYTPQQMRRHEVKPGITGWAQVNGRNSLSWDAKFELDVWYVDNWTVLLDLKILLMTIKRVIRREGISQQGHVTMEEFRGDSSC